MKTLEKDHRDKESKLKSEIADLKCRSMRDNLLFFQIPEEKGESCEGKILNFIENELSIENASTEIKLHRAHRVGSFKRGKTPPIVAKFAFYPDRERVRDSAKKLKNTNYGIAEQYPREVMDTRRKLIPIMRKAREDGREAYLRVDKLYIDKKLYEESS